MISWKELLNEIAHPVRIQVLFALGCAISSFTDLSKQIEISNSELSRHLNRLVNNHFIQKSANGKKYELSNMGKLFLKAYQPIDFILKHSEYINAHDLSSLPPDLLSQIHLLSTTELITGTGLVMQKMQEMIERTQQHVKIMVDNPFPFGKDGLSVSYIAPPQMMALKDKVEIVNKNTEIKGLMKIPVAIAITDMGEGMIVFSEVGKGPDYSTMFYIDSEKSPGFHFIKAVWEYFWNHAISPDDFPSQIQ